MDSYFIKYNNIEGKTVPGSSKANAEEFLLRSTPGVKVINEVIRIKGDLKRRLIKKSNEIHT